MKPQLSLRTRAAPKPPPPGIVLSEASTDHRNFKLSAVGSRGSSAPLAQLEGEMDEMQTVEQREAVLKRYELEIAAQRKALKDQRIQIEEERREASERLLLAEKREAIIEKKESLLQANSEQLHEAQDLQSLLENQSRLEREIRGLKEKLLQAEELIENLKRDQVSDADPITLVADPDAAFTTHAVPTEPGLDCPESVSINDEREAYIEASEEALLLKAQQLEELENHLRQWEEELDARSKAASA